MMQNADDKIVCLKQSCWRGYSIDALEQRRTINHVKCTLIKEQFTMAYKTLTTSFTSPDNGKFSLRLNQAVTYSIYGLRLYKHIRNIVRLYKKI